MKGINKENAITLVSLIITIALMIIIATVTIGAISGEEIIDKAQDTKISVEETSIKEQIKMEALKYEDINNTEITEEKLNEIISKYGTIEYREGKKILIPTDTDYKIDVTNIYN